MGRKSNIKEKLVMAADIFFVLILCFIILFSTLVVTNNISLNDYSVNGYSINIPILAGVAVSIGAYLLFMLTASLKGYKEVEEAYYKSEEEKNGSHS
jgi:TRAP-type C4-dicarboxylate transport system permease small subunit